MAGHAQLKFVITECSKTQIRLTGFKLKAAKLKITITKVFCMLININKRTTCLSWTVCKLKFEIRKIAVCFLWLSLPGDYRVTDEA